MKDIFKTKINTQKNNKIIHYLDHGEFEKPQEEKDT